MRTLLALVFLASGPAMVAAQQPAPPTIDQVIERSFFHVEVSGTTADGSVVQRGGKGFAIAPDVIMTALHLVGTSVEWKPDARDPDGLDRITHPVLRTLTLFNRAGRITSDNALLPGPPLDSDTAAILVPDLPTEPYFRLSLCPIVQTGKYTAVVSTRDHPEQPDAIIQVAQIGLSARGYQPAKYGPLYVFDLDRETSFSPEPDGHEGSPILDQNNEVVAIISMVIAEGGHHRILATPIQPLIPAASLALLGNRPTTGGPAWRPSCSLAESVDRLQEDVARLAIWNIEIQRDAKGKVDTLVLGYDSAGRDPRITSVKVYYGFYGDPLPFVHDDTVPQRLSFADPNNGVIEMEQSTTDKRSFITHRLGMMGRDLVEPFVKTVSEGRGYVDHVEIYIVPMYVDLQGEVVSKRFPWLGEPPVRGGAVR